MVFQSWLDVALSSTELRPAVSVSLPNRSVFCNLNERNPQFYEHMSTSIYTPRMANVDAISLFELPPNITLYGGGEFLASHKDQFFSEQHPPYIEKSDEAVSAIINVARTAEDVERECLLIARFGLGTWGHWLGELLPKIVLVEQACPGRFSYVLPDFVANGTAGTIWGNIRESIEAFGVKTERIFAIEIDKNYTFKHLYVVSSIWSDHIMHPAASAVMREHLHHIEPGHREAVAIMRVPDAGRQINNAEEVYAELNSRGFQSVEIGKASFLDQVRLFKGAEKLFAVLGSDLTGLIFSPRGVGLVSAAPDTFGDRFFYALILDREGVMADLRGPITKEHAIHHKGAFNVDRNKLLAALQAIQAPA